MQTITRLPLTSGCDDYGLKFHEFAGLAPTSPLAGEGQAKSTMPKDLPLSVAKEATSLPQGERSRKPLPLWEGLACRGAHKMPHQPRNKFGNDQSEN